MILTLSILVMAAAPACAQGVLKETHGDWQMRCETGPPPAQAGAPAAVAGAPGAGASAAGAGARDQCALVQSVAAEDKPGVTLVAIALKTVDGKSRLLRVVAPLNVLLPAGRDVRTMPARACQGSWPGVAPRGRTAGKDRIDAAEGPIALASPLWF